MVSSGSPMKTLISPTSILHAILCIALSACGIYETKTQQADSASLSALVNDPHVVVSYAQVNQFVFQSCVHCHSAAQAKDGVILDSYARVISLLPSVKSDIDIGKMPLGSSLTADQKALFDKWVSEGSPEGGGTSDSPVSSITPTPTVSPSASPNPEDQVLTVIRNNYNLFVQPLVQKGCMDCHDSSAKPEGIGNIPIVKGVELKHIQEASRVLDFSQTFPAWSTQSSSPVYFLNQIKTVIQNKTMSPKYYQAFHEFDGKTLKSAENQVILNWIDDSLKLLSQVITSPPTAQTYFSDNCTGCHSGAGASAGFAFVKSGDQWVIPSGSTDSGIPYLTPAHPELSAVYLVLLSKSTDRHGLAQMPFGSSASADDQKLIFDWITAGAVSNSN